MLCDGRLPEAWISPEHVRQWRSRARPRHTLIDERAQWLQRDPGELVDHGVGGAPERLRTSEGRALLEQLPLPADARERIEIALEMIDAIEAQLAPLERELRQLARRQTGYRALMRLYRMGELTALVTLCELGDVGRLSASRKAVRMAGVDIGIDRSDRRARVGKLTRQGSPQLALGALPGRTGGLPAQQPRPRRLPRAEGPRPRPHARASLTIACKLARRSFGVLRRFGPAALDPIATS